MSILVTKNDVQLNHYASLGCSYLIVGQWPMRKNVEIITSTTD